jgi:hypothetical protein
MAKEGNMATQKETQKEMGLGFVFPITLLALMASLALTGKVAAAPSAELARKCHDLMIKVYPPVRPGSPQGNAQKERDYFQTCIARNGKMEEPSTVGREPEKPSEDKSK